MRIGANRCATIRGGPGSSTARLADLSKIEMIVSPKPLSTGAAATSACLYEATAQKPGNVHPGAGFDDVTYADFVISALAIGPIVERSAARGVGQTVLDAVRATRAAVGTNTNLGTLLLIAPLAVVQETQQLEAGMSSVLGRLDYQDTRLVYEAIRLSAAGGLGRAQQADVFSDPPANLTLVDAMRLAAESDLVARQYTNGFADVLGGTAVWIAEGLVRGWSLSASIVFTHIRQMAAHADSLIRRKCGEQIAVEASERAQVVLCSGEPGDEKFELALKELDSWLRADGHRRNPGTTADLIAAGLFVLLREGRLPWQRW
jgi:triphosphoribosyl-dephospho-CoA synthase